MAADGQRAGAPRPGDARAGGPRPAATPQDLVWGALAATLLLVTVVQFVGLAIALFGLDAAPTGGGLVLGFLITVVWLVTIHWLVLGAWRRSVWGCAFEHAADAREARRCQRHATVTASTRTADEPGEHRLPQ